MSVNSSFTLCPQAPNSAFSILPAANGQRKRPSLLVRSLHRGNSPVATAAAEEEEDSARHIQFHSQPTSHPNRLLRGTFPENLRDSRLSRDRPSILMSTGGTAAAKAYSPFETLVNERHMNRGRISPLSQAEFLAWKQQQRQTQYQTSGDHATVDWEEEPTTTGAATAMSTSIDVKEAKEDTFGAHVPAAYKKRRLQQLEARQHIFANLGNAKSGENGTSTATTKPVTAFQAPRAIRATPFEPLVHQRNLKDGNLSVGFGSNWTTATDDHNIIKSSQQQHHDDTAATTTTNDEKAWKRRCQRAELARLESRQQLLGMVDENRQLKIQLIHQKAAQLMSSSSLSTKSHQTTRRSILRNSTNTSHSNSHHPRRHQSPQGRQDQDTCKEMSLAHHDDASATIMSETGAACKSSEKPGAVPDTSAIYSNSIATMMKSQNDTTITEEEEDEKPSFINLKRGTGRSAKRSQESPPPTDYEDDARETSAVNLFGNDDTKELLEQEPNESKPELDDSALLGCWNRVDTSNVSSDASSHKQRRLSFDVESLPQEEQKEPATLASADGEVPEECLQSDKKSACSTPGSFLLDGSIASQSGCEVVIDGGDNSLSALDVSAITSSSPTPIKFDRAASTCPEDEPVSFLQDPVAVVLANSSKPEKAVTDDNDIEDENVENDLQDSNVEEHYESTASNNKDGQACADEKLFTDDEIAAPPPSPKELIDDNTSWQDHNEVGEKPKESRVSKRSNKSRRKRTPMKGLQPSGTSFGPSRATRSRARKPAASTEKPLLDETSDISAGAAFSSSKLEILNEDENPEETTKRCDDVPDNSCSPEHPENKNQDLSPVHGEKQDSGSAKPTVHFDNSGVENPMEDGDVKEPSTRSKPEKSMPGEDAEPLAASLTSKTSNALQEGGKRRGRRRRGTLPTPLPAPALKKNRRQMR